MLEDMQEITSGEEFDREVLGYGVHMIPDVIVFVGGKLMSGVVLNQFRIHNGATLDPVEDDLDQFGRIALVAGVPICPRQWPNKSVVARHAIAAIPQVNIIDDMHRRLVPGDLGYFVPSNFEWSQVKNVLQ